MTLDRVECRSDHDYVGHPLAFYWQGKRLEVTKVLAQIKTPQGTLFRVQNDVFGIFELDYDPNADQWSVYQP